MVVLGAARKLISTVSERVWSRSLRVRRRVTRPNAAAVARTLVRSAQLGSPSMRAAIKSPAEEPYAGAIRSMAISLRSRLVVPGGCTSRKKSCVPCAGPSVRTVPQRLVRVLTSWSRSIMSWVFTVRPPRPRLAVRWVRSRKRHPAPQPLRSSPHWIGYRKPAPYGQREDSPKSCMRSVRPDDLRLSRRPISWLVAWNRPLSESLSARRRAGMPRRAPSHTSSVSCGDSDRDRRREPPWPPYARSADRPLTSLDLDRPRAAGPRPYGRRECSGQSRMRSVSPRDLRRLRVLSQESRPEIRMRSSLGDRPEERSLLVLDIVFIAGVIGLFALIGLLGKALEKL